MTRPQLAAALCAVVALVAVWTARAPEPGPPEAAGPGARIVSLTPQITETVAFLGAADRLVGRSDWCAEPPAVRALPAVGSALQPDLERIVGLRPDRILVDASVGTASADLARLGPPVVTLPWLTRAEAVASIRRLGPVLDRVDAANALADRFDAALSGAPPDTAPRVLLAMGGALSDREVWFLKRNSLHGDALHAAGFRNAVDREEPGAPVLSLEAVVALDPDAVVVVTASPVGEADRERIVASWARLAPLRAVQAGRVTAIGGPLLLSTGPALLDLPAAIAGALARVGVVPP